MLAFIAPVRVAGARPPVPAPHPRVSARAAPRPPARASRPRPAAWRDPSLPPGAVALPSVRLSLADRLGALSFGYEAAPPGPTLAAAGAASAAAAAAAAPVRCGACPVRYLCERGHVVTAHRESPAARGCPLCNLLSCARGCNASRARLSVGALRAIAAERGGRCLALQYESARTPVAWRCARGHVWLATPDNVKSRVSWCPECAVDRKRLSIEDMHAMAHERGGLCLSDRYVSGAAKLRWRCAAGHEFALAPNNMRRSAGSTRKPSWCAVCARARRRSCTTAAPAPPGPGALAAAER